MNSSIVRRGNHFIRLEGEWCLIDGPWFNYLEGFYRYSSTPIFISVVDPHPRYYKFEDFDFPSHTNIRCMEWEPRRWYPEYIYPPIIFKDRWNEWMNGRIKTGYVLLPDGKLPAFMGMEVPEDADDWWWDSAWWWERGMVNK